MKSTHTKSTLIITRYAVVWLSVSLVLVIIGWFKVINLLLLIGYVMLALLAWNSLLAWRGIRAMALHRQPLLAGFGHQRLPITVELDHVGTALTTVTVVAKLLDQSLRWFVTEFPLGGHHVLTNTIATPGRGVYLLPPLQGECDYPFGLIRWTRDFGTSEELVILPRVGQVHLADFRHWLARGDGEDAIRRPSRRLSLGSGEVRGVRPYRAGDSLRDVHWKSTARRGAIVVREYDQYESAHLVVIVDPSVNPAISEAESALAFEHMLELAMSIGWAWALGEESNEITLIVPGGTQPWQTGPANRAFVRQAFAALARLQPQPERATCPVERLRRLRGSRLVISTQPNGGPLAEELRQAGLAFRGWQAGCHPHWYSPPHADSEMG
ncbi:MAG: DUF58 domain-containing protein [Bacteroidales bacterium]|nr:DUF58 domain-containing protein [Bacteroidales bacterium]